MKYSTILLILFFLQSCDTPKSNKEKKIKLKISKEIELLTTNQLISKYPLLSKTDTDLKTKTFTYFNQYKQDTIVPLFLSMASKKINGKTKFGYFSFDKPIDLIAHYSLDKSKMINYPIKNNASFEIFKDKKDSLLQFLKLYQDFYKTSNFDEYFSSNRPLYKELIDTVEKELNNENLIGTLEQFYGKTQKSYNVILSPLQNAGGYSVKIKNDLIAIVGAGLINGLKPKFDIEYLKKELILHEFSHSFCNQIINKYMDELIFMEDLDENFRFKMASLGYHQKESILYEYLVRSCVIRMVNTLYGQEESENLLNQEIDNGFYLMPDFNEALKFYESNRNKYKTLEEYFPELISRLKIASNAI